jgi:hypothetical protein
VPGARIKQVIETATDRRTWTRAAAWNNAEWCAAVCRTNRQETSLGSESNTGGTFTAQAWSSDGRPPTLYPDLVTLDQHTDRAQVLERVDLSGPGGSVKDSFGTLDLTGDGFSRLFDARWILRAPELRTPAADPGTIWSVVTSGTQLHSWATGWAAGQGHADIFRPGLLDEPNVAVLAGHSALDGRLLAGAVANRSAAVVGVVGISNVFAVDGRTDAAWAGAVRTAQQRWSGLPMVGYEADGEDLDAALDTGFGALDPLTVWVRW